MKQLLYIAFKDKSANHHGIEKKVISQCVAFEKQGFSTTLIQRNGSTIVLDKVGESSKIISENSITCNSPKLRSLIDKHFQIKTIKDHIKKNYYDCCYIRYDLCSPNFISLLRLLKKRGSKIIIEIPTFPYKHEYASTILHKIKFCVDKLLAPKMKKYVDKIVTFYNSDVKIHGIDTISIPNGFDFSQLQLVDTSIKHNKDEIHVIGVASMREWHGYERFILGLKEYYNSNPGRKVIFHIVGEGRESSKYRHLVMNSKLESYVLFHGIMQGESLNELFNICDLGVDSLARHRTNISVLSSLKSREYGAKGLPFINSCDIDILPHDYKYLLKVPANEAPINICDVVDFYDKVYLSGKVRWQIATEIRTYIKSKADMPITLKPILEFLSTK